MTDGPQKGLHEVWAREAQHHDALAASTDPDSIHTVELDLWKRALVDIAGDIAGKDVLELGCGTGDLTIELLKRGAIVTALDISPGMVDFAKTRVAKVLPGSKPTFVAEPAEATSLDSDSFDLIVGASVLHHVNVADTAAEMARLLRPGGRGIFVETSGLNPLLRWSRRWLAGRFGIHQCGTKDEHPLVAADLRELSRALSPPEHVYPDFNFLRILARNVFQYRSRRVNIWSDAADRFVYRRFPRLRRYSYHMILVIHAQPRV